MSMIYAWKNGFRLHGDPQVIGEALKAIEEEYGSISPEIIVEKAKPIDSLLHSYFEWDDAKAAAERRLDQARYMARGIAVVIDRPNADPIETRAFVEIQQEDAEGNYVSIDAVIENDDMRKQLIRSALRDIEIFQRKYAIIEEVFELVDSLRGGLSALI